MDMMIELDIFGSKNEKKIKSLQSVAKRIAGVKWPLSFHLSNIGLLFFHMCLSSNWSILKE